MNKEFTLTVDGKKINTKDIENLFPNSINNKKTIVDQNNPLLERATQILATIK
ncbi:MAG: hypothetical protein WCD89_27490 [Anaerocolumna sp.]